jgi:hydroxypyruvate reductase
MARTFQAAVGAQTIFQMIVVTNPENACTLNGAEVLTTSHPLPSQAGADAAIKVEAMLEQAGPQDQVVALISGGGSALLPAPKVGISLADKIIVNALLLAKGFDIRQINLIRQALSRLKGGGMLRIAAPTPVTAFILSDVIGDDLAVIASGPTVAPIGKATDAIALLQNARLWEKIPFSVKQVLKASQTALERLPSAKNILIASNWTALAAMRAACPIKATIICNNLVGDVQNAAQTILKAAEIWDGNSPTALIFGGETTVTLRGTGMGGRNQELALRIAQAHSALPQNFAFISGGTDGRDGPTDSAGGIVDAGSWARIAKAGGDPTALLANNDSYQALSLSQDLLFTKTTGTNVADVQVLILIP